jgi:DNA (cytosine-5)-methyltransferase 1
VPQTLKIRAGCEGGGKGCLVQSNKSATLSTHNDQTLFEPKAAAFMGGQGADAGSIAYSEKVSPTIRGQAGGNSVPMVMTPSEPKMYGICSQHSNSMKSSNPNSGIYEMDTSRTLDTGACTGNGGQVVVAFTQNQRDEVRDLHDCAGALAAEPGMKQQTYVAIPDEPSDTLEGNGTRPSHKGSGIGEDVSFTLNGTEQHQVAYAMTTGCYTQVCEEKTPTLQARDYKDAPVVAKGPGAVARPENSRYVVRRLTPIECALLQGFPPDWCNGLETPEPTEEDIAFWNEVFVTHAAINGKKPKSRAQIIKWLKNPYSDGAAYKMWGNGVALPNVHFVLSGISHIMHNDSP